MGLNPLTKSQEIALAQQQTKVCSLCGTEKRGCEFYHDRGTGKLRPYCKKCNLVLSKKSQTRWKQALVNEAGGSCRICGYSRCLSALTFHHIDPSQKDFGISELKGSNLEAARAEIRKCILLCCRCHAEVHAGVAHI